MAPLTAQVWAVYDPHGPVTVPSLIPRSRATTAIGFFVSCTMRTAPARNFGSNLRLVFTDDVAVHSPRVGELRGIDKVVGYLRQAEVEGEHTQHVTTDLLVDVDGDQAAASAFESFRW